MTRLMAKINIKGVEYRVVTDDTGKYRIIAKQYHPSVGYRQKTVCKNQSYSDCLWMIAQYAANLGI